LCFPANLAKAAPAWSLRQRLIERSYDETLCHFTLGHFSPLMYGNTPASAVSAKGQVDQAETPRATEVRSDDLSIRIVTTEPEFALLRSSWNALLQRSSENVPFLTHEWMGAWWIAFSAGRAMYLVTAWLGADLVGIAPLLVDQHGSGTRARPTLRFWSNAYSNRAQIIVGEPLDEIIDALLRHLVHEAPDWDLVHLGPLDAGSRVTQAITRALERAGVRYGLDDGIRSPFLRLPSSWEELLGQVSSSHRQTVRRKRRKAASQFRFRRILNREGFRHVLTVSEESWQHAGGTGLGTQPEVKAFYERLAAEAEQNGWLELALLEDAEEAVAYEFNLVYGNKLFNLKLGYRRDLARSSPGLVLKSHVLEDAIARGIEEHDFLGADEPYKLHWTAHVRQHCKVVIFRPGRKTLDWFYRYRLKPYVRRRLPAIPKLKRWLRNP
jgi:CelD/BcsL family acetyltransferase involved in cellulose biosynthesis